MRLSLAAVVFAVAALPVFADPTVDDVGLVDAEGKSRKLSDYADRKAVVLAFIGTECPQANRYLPEILAVAAEYEAKGVAFLAVNPNKGEHGDVALHAKERDVRFPVLLDPDLRLADAAGVKVTPTVVVLDGARALKYRGRVDGQPMGSATTGADLRKALDAVLGGDAVEVPETEARGCALRRGEPAKDGAVTWAKDVAPIVYANCVSCHRSGNIGPMPLTDYQHVSAFSQEILAAVKAKRMPPWKPSAGMEFVGERKLTADQIGTIEKWVLAGTPEGNPADEPELPTAPEDAWELGEPDLVLDAGEDFDVKPGPDLYWHFVMPKKWDSDTWISSVEVRPGNRRIVHHVLAYIDTMGAAKKLDKQDERLGYKGSGAFPGFVPTHEMGGWTPGHGAETLPDGVARLLPHNGTLVLQVHYNNTTGKTQKDRTKIGLYFAKKPVKKRLYQARILNPMFAIPPGATAHEVKASWPVNRNITVISVMPHAHLIAKRAEMVAVSDSGEERTIIEIDDWDFKWQDAYLLKTPLKLTDGARVKLKFVYDNSGGNPRNPHSPPREINWGERTSDEMCLGYVNYVRNSQDLTKEKGDK